MPGKVLVYFCSAGGKHPPPLSPPGGINLFQRQQPIVNVPTTHGTQTRAFAAVAGQLLPPHPPLPPLMP